MSGEDQPDSPNTGLVTAVRDSVVDVRFEGRLPSIRTLLRAGANDAMAIEVLTHIDARHVRGIALTPTQGLARGMPVTDTGGPLLAPVGKAILSRMFDVFGHAIDQQCRRRLQFCWRSPVAFSIPLRFLVWPTLSSLFRMPL
jgi:F-type H+-transporting ATPase subunit beta